MISFIRITILPLIFIVYSFNIKAQHQPQLVKTLYTYTFSNINSTTDIEGLTKEISNLKGVIVCKPVLKLEQNIGQVIVIVEEYSRTSEGQEMFEPTDLKKIISNNGLIPNELTTEPYNN